MALSVPKGECPDCGHTTYYIRDKDIYWCPPPNCNKEYKVSGTE